MFWLKFTNFRSKRLFSPLFKLCWSRRHKLNSNKQNKIRKLFFFGISWSKWQFLIKIGPPTDKLIQQLDISVVTSCKHKCCAIVLCLARRVEKTVKLYGWYWYHLVLLWYPAQLWIWSNKYWFLVILIRQLKHWFVWIKKCITRATTKLELHMKAPRKAQILLFQMVWTVFKIARWWRL